MEGEVEGALDGYMDVAAMDGAIDGDKDEARIGCTVGLKEGSGPLGMRHSGAIGCAH